MQRRLSILPCISVLTVALNFVWNTWLSNYILKRPALWVSKGYQLSLGSSLQEVGSVLWLTWDPTAVSSTYFFLSANRNQSKTNSNTKPTSLAAHYTERWPEALRSTHPIVFAEVVNPVMLADSAGSEMLFPCWAEDHTKLSSSANIVALSYHNDKMVPASSLACSQSTRRARCCRWALLLRAGDGSRAQFRSALLLLVCQAHVS